MLVFFFYLRHIIFFRCWFSYLSGSLMFASTVQIIARVDKPFDWWAPMGLCITLFSPFLELLLKDVKNYEIQIRYHFPTINIISSS